MEGCKELLVLGEPLYYDSATAHVCISCINKAIKLIPKKPTPITDNSIKHFQESRKNKDIK
jgi:hypothetical protein